jgi:hypothetical protein
LAFGIGNIQGVDLSITRFSGTPDGKYSGAMKAIIMDHFGSNDGDLASLAGTGGQASLWLMQRGLCSDQDTSRYKPYVIKIIVEDVEFSGQLK